MNKEKYFGILCSRMSSDGRLLMSHVSLVGALFLCWQNTDFQIPFRVTRKLLMRYSKIASVATYHKCMRELQEAGYIRYQPSYHPKLGSLVFWKLDGFQ